MIRDWKPEPLVPALPADYKEPRSLIVQGTSDAHVTIQGGRSLVNFGSCNFLGLASAPQVKVCRAHPPICLFRTVPCDLRVPIGVQFSWLPRRRVKTPFASMASAPAARAAFTAPLVPKDTRACFTCMH